MPSVLPPPKDWRVFARGPLATSARGEAGRTHVELNNGCAFEFPAAQAQAQAQAQGLAGAKAADLITVEISGSRLGLRWSRLDAKLYLPTLVKGVLGTKHWMAQIGAAGGSAVTAAKGEAARANGRWGGRPKKAGRWERADAAGRDQRVTEPTGAGRRMHAREANEGRAPVRAASSERKPPCKNLIHSRT